MTTLKNALSKIHRYWHFALIVLGVLSIVFHEDIAKISVFPYVFGGIILAIGVYGVLASILKLTKKKLTTTAFACGLSLIALGIITFVKTQNQFFIVFYVAIVWALISIIKGTMQLIYGIEEAKQKLKRSIFNFAQAIFGLTLGIILLIEPNAESILHHVILFGVELILSAIGEFFGLEEEVSIWQILDIKKHKKAEDKEISEIEVEEKKAS